MGKYLADNVHDLPSRLTLAQDVVKCGMALQQVNIVHGDIRMDNFLVDDTGKAILGDFGIADVGQGLGPTESMREVNQNGRYWVAPEWESCHKGLLPSPPRLLFLYQSPGNRPPPQQPPGSWTDMYAIAQVIIRILLGKASPMVRALEDSTTKSFDSSSEAVEYMKRGMPQWVELFRLVQVACSKEIETRKSVSYVDLFLALERLREVGRREGGKVALQLPASLLRLQRPAAVVHHNKQNGKKRAPPLATTHDARNNKVGRRC